MALILIVDDERLLATVVSRFVTSIGHVPLWATDIVSALVMIDRHPVAMIMTDVHLGADYGLDLLVELRARHSSIPVMVMSGRLDDSIRRDAHDLGAVACFSKPLPFDEVRRTIDMHVTDGDESAP